MRTRIKKDWSQQRVTVIRGKQTAENLESKNGKKKYLYGYFKLEIKEIARDTTWKWLRKGNLKREIESLLIAAQNNVITNPNSAAI